MDIRNINRKIYRVRYTLQSKKWIKQKKGVGSKNKEKQRKEKPRKEKER